MALGAEGGRVRRLLLRESLGAVCPGRVLGLTAAAALSDVVESLLFGVTPLDPQAFAAAGGVLLVVAAMAAWLPAWMASRVDPMSTLRT